MNILPLRGKLWRHFKYTSHFDNISVNQWLLIPIWPLAKIKPARKKLSVFKNFDQALEMWLSWQSTCLLCVKSRVWPQYHINHRHLEKEMHSIMLCHCLSHVCGARALLHTWSASPKHTPHQLLKVYNTERICNVPWPQLITVRILKLFPFMTSASPPERLMWQWVSRYIKYLYKSNIHK